MTLRAVGLAVCLLFAQQRSIADIVTDFKKLVAELESQQPQTGATVTVALGDLQGAIDRAKPGDTLILQAGVKYTEALTLPAKTGLVTVRSSSTLPDRRVSPNDAPLLATIASGNNGPALTGVGAKNWKFNGLQLECTANGAGEVVQLEDAEQITLDRILMVCGANGQKRGIRGNGKQITLTRSYIANIIRAGQDSQAFAAWEGAGPYTITDNYLEASGENILFGGSDNYLGGAASNPADILIAGNHLFKPLAWKNQPGTVKNLLELKNATRAVVRDNLLEHNWTDAQPGWGVVLTPKNQDGRAPWTTLKDVLVERNYLRGVERGFNIIGRDYAHVTQQATGIVIRKNVIETAGQCFQVGGEVADLTVEDNVCDNGYNIATLYVGGVLDMEGGSLRDALFAIGRLTFNRNVARHNDYGIIGGGIGTPALVANTQSYEFVQNRFVGLIRTYPATTTDLSEADFQTAKAAVLATLR